MNIRLSISILAAAVITTALSAQPADPSVYSARRAEIMKRAGKNAIVIPGVNRTPYGQNDEASAKYFYYLTGWDTPGAWMIITPGRDKEYSLFIAPQGMARSGWDNGIPGMAEAIDKWKADTVYPVMAFKSMAPELLKGYDTIWTTPASRLATESVQGLFTGDDKPVILDLRQKLNDMRLVKDDYEIAMLTRAIEVTAEAEREAMMLAADGRWEYELQAAIEHVYRSRGCDGPGFTTIIGSGPNSTILHYDLNTRQLKNGDVVVMDIGAAEKGYIADITRTIPVSGEFTKEQADIYNIVLRAQEAAIAEMIPGKRTLAAHDRASRVIMSGLYDLGLVTDTASKWQKQLFILYTCTHHIGLDVHDTYPYQLTPADEGVLKPGMVITVEPGIYLNADLLVNLGMMAKGRPEEKEIKDYIAKVSPLFEKYRSIGVRIEDDILITDTGNRILSATAPKEPSEIRRLMKKKGSYR